MMKQEYSRRRGLSLVGGGEDASHTALPGEPAGLMGLLREQLRLLDDLRQYRSAKAQITHAVEEFHALFRRFIGATLERRCLRLAYGDTGAESLGANWVGLDLSLVERDAREQGCLALPLDDAQFDAVLCTGMDRISQPGQLAAEIARVLDRNGQVWVQVPLSAPYFSDEIGDAQEFWRITPHGLRLLLGDFDEILSSVYLPGGTALRSFSFYYGLRGVRQLGQAQPDCAALMSC